MKNCPKNRVIEKPTDQYGNDTNNDRKRIGINAFYGLSRHNIIFYF